MNINGFSIINLEPLPIKNSFIGVVACSGKPIAIICFNTKSVVITFYSNQPIDKYFLYFTRDRVFDLIDLSLIYDTFHIFNPKKLAACQIDGKLVMIKNCSPDKAVPINISDIINQYDGHTVSHKISEIHEFTCEADFDLPTKLWDKNQKCDDGSDIGLLLGRDTLVFLPSEVSE